ncbi:MAG: hypothetical protein KIT80_19425 [Chitinophagaceae bacterium]|nr:hypothetical protein [Chitinophagaceae bacterium]MCW5929100.1 hypothetical protein [Chitinophagaceae bacterium]
MKYGLLSLLALALGYMVYAQDVDALIQQAEQSEKDLKEAEALTKYKEVLAVQPGNIKALCKVTELTARTGNRLKDAKQRLAAFTEAKKYADTVLEAAPANADANYVFAEVAAKMTTVTSGKEKARYLRDFKNYTDTALQLNANHAKALYLLGKWNFDVSTLNTAEKAAVKVLFGGIPRASVLDAIKSYEKARTADPLLLVNYLDLAKAYVKNHQTDKAIEVLNKLVKLPPKTGDDDGYKAEGRSMLAGLQ